MDYGDYLIDLWSGEEMRFCGELWKTYKPSNAKDENDRIEEDVYTAGELIYHFLKNYKDELGNRQFFEKHNIKNDKALVMSLFSPVSKHYRVSKELVKEHFLRHYCFEFFGVFIPPKPQENVEK